MNYLILPSNSLGGSEVRLVNNWVYSRQTGIDCGVKLVVTEKLLNAFSKREKAYRGLSQFSDHIITCSFPDDFVGIQDKLKLLTEKELVELETAIILLHVPLRAKRNKAQKFVYIHPGNSFFKDSNVKGVVGQILNVLKADIIDVLDPRVFLMLKKIFFFKKRIYFTQFGISQYSFDLVDKVNYNTKQNRLVFLGRFIAIKQVLEFLGCVNDIWTEVCSARIPCPQIIVIGQGPLETEVSRHIYYLQKQGVNIEHLKTENPFDILIGSKVYFSLQKYNNYPSQSLIESILCGCIPIVTNCGSSKMLLEPGNAYLVKEKFTAKQIAAHCVSILSLSEKEFEAKSVGMINYLTVRYSPSKMAKYYHQLRLPSE
jgi:glycosyltransferase involved in cell wall biosynthesis